MTKDKEIKDKKSFDDDVWKTEEDDDDIVPWRDQTTKERVKTVVIGIIKTILLIGCLYLFVCSLVMMTSALNILAGRAAVDVFTSNVFLSNPITGLIIGILVTVVIQSSSTSTSIVIAMVASGIITVNKAIPIVMGANIGTSVTNTGVALTLSVDRERFRRAFAGATIHDCFNFLSVLVLLILEVISGYLEALSGAVVRSLSDTSAEAAPKFLKIITNPVVAKTVKVNKTVQKKIAAGVPLEDEASLVQVWCKQTKATIEVNMTDSDGNVTFRNQTVLVGLRKCDRGDFLFANSSWSEQAIGGFLFAISMIVLVASLLCMVKILVSSLKGGLKTAIRKAVNTNFPSPFGWLSGYVAIFIGCGVTMLIQSSSVVTSTLTPLVGIGVVKLKRMFCVTIGANLGTTFTALLAALATGDLRSLQLAFVHFFFNLSGFILWYPLPFMRKIPLKAAEGLGNITAKYRWFAIVYVAFVFFILPLVVLGLSFTPVWFLATVIITAIVFVIIIIIINVLQTKRPSILPAKLRSWDWLPLWMHSLRWWDRVIIKAFGWCRCCKCCHQPLDEPPATPTSPITTYENAGFEDDSKV